MGIANILYLVSVRKNFIPMKKISSFLLLNLFLVQIICAQSIETGKSLYEQGDYKRAILVFENVETLESQLFLGKATLLNEII